MSPEPAEQTPKMDAADLWREEIFTDRKVGTIRRLTPVKPDGSLDPARRIQFIGEASLYTHAGTLPLTFEIPADSLEKAVQAYGDEVQRAFQDAMEELKELRRKAASQIVIPQGGASGLTGGPGGLGGGPLPPGAGKLKL